MVEHGARLHRVRRSPRAAYGCRMRLAVSSTYVYHQLSIRRTSSGLPAFSYTCVMPWSDVEVLLMWRQPLASRALRIDTARLSTSIRPRYTSRAAFTVGDSMIVDLLGTNVRLFGITMSSNSLLVGFGDEVVHPAVRAKTSKAVTVC